MNNIIIIFCALLINFSLMVSVLFIPLLRRGFFISITAFLGLGLLLVIVTLRQRVGGKLKFFLILTGASAVAFVASMLLHNLIYGLFVFFFGPEFWMNIGIMDEPIFFFIAVLICPIAFLVGVIGSIIMLIKEAKK